MYDVNRRINSSACIPRIHLLTRPSSSYPLATWECLCFYHFIINKDTLMHVNFHVKWQKPRVCITRFPFPRLKFEILLHLFPRRNAKRLGGVHGGRLRSTGYQEFHIGRHRRSQHWMELRRLRASGTEQDFCKSVQLNTSVSNFAARAMRDWQDCPATSTHWWVGLYLMFLRSDMPYLSWPIHKREALSQYYIQISIKQLVCNQHALAEDPPPLCSQECLCVCFSAAECRQSRGIYKRQEGHPGVSILYSRREDS